MADLEQLYVYLDQFSTSYSTNQRQLQTGGFFSLDLKELSV